MAVNKRKVLDTARKYVQKGAKQKALKEYERLLKLDPKDGKLRLEIGDTHRRWGQIDEATSQYTKVADQYKQDGFDARSVAVYKQVLNLDPKRYSAYVALSELYQRMGLDAEAIAALQTAADGYHKEGQKREALELLRKMATLDPTNTTSRMKVAELLRQEGLEDEAITEYEAVALELDRQGALEQVAGVYARILEAQPGRVDILVATARTLLRLRQPERAEPFAKQAAQADAADIEKAELLCDIYKALDRVEELADATRSLAKIYRDRGDDDRAREIMQRVPATESMAMESEEPSFGATEDFSSADDDAALEDDDLLDDDFLATDDNEISMTFPAEEPAPVVVAPPVEESVADETAEAVLPDGAPDQLFAEASVYLRYGKRDQAIASLRGIVAQEPKHRGALEKLGEAFAEDGNTVLAVENWIKAAHCAAEDDDGSAFGILRDRIAALDEDAAAALTPPPSSSSAAQPDVAPSGAADAVAADLDLDIDIDMDVDVAADVAAPPAADDSMDFDSEIEIDLDADEAAAAAPVASDAEEEIEFDIDLDLAGDDAEAESSVDTEPSDEIDLEVDLSDATEGIAADFNDDTPGDGDDPDPDADAELSIEFADADIDVAIDDAPADLVAGAAADAADDVLDDTSEVDIDIALDDQSAVASQDAGSSTRSGSLSATTSQQITDELEEAEFYFGQSMHDEAEAIYRRILELAPNHPSALLRLGEIFAARGGDAADVSSNGGVTAEAGEGALSTPTLDQVSDDDEEEDTQSEIVVDFAAEGGISESSDSSGSAEVDDNDGDDDGGLDLAAELAADLDVTTDADPDDDTQDVAAELSDDTIDVPDVPDVADVPDETQPIAIEGDAEDVDDSVEAVVDSGVDEEAMFDLAAELREAMEGEGDPNGTTSSGTVDDGFDSIFSEFKKGVSQTLSEGDTETRYDLGIAYREMGLFEDAIGEFRVCLESDGRRLDSLTMMALCALDVGRPGDAVAHFEQALATGDLPETQRTGLQYELGLALEQTGDRARAKASFEQVAEADPSFRDVVERLAELEIPAPDGSVEDEDDDSNEGFESFDDIIADAEVEPEAVSAEALEEEPEAEAEAFESFDDVIADAEAIDPTEDDAEEPLVAEFESLEDEAVEDEDSQGSIAVEVEATPAPPEPTRKPKGKKKKISFV